VAPTALTCRSWGFAIPYSNLMRTKLLALATALLAYPQDKANLYVVHQIKQEAMQNSKVMDHVFWLTDVNGHPSPTHPVSQKRRNGSRNA